MRVSFRSATVGSFQGTVHGDRRGVALPPIVPVPRVIETMVADEIKFHPLPAMPAHTPRQLLPRAARAVESPSGNMRGIIAQQSAIHRAFREQTTSIRAG
jgi:hypothetical protein